MVHEKIMGIEDLITPRDIPRTTLAGVSLHRSNGFEYTLNSHGYRSPDFKHRGKINILSAGSEFMFGEGLPQGELFSEIVRKQIALQCNCTVTLWNLGCLRYSNDSIARVLHHAVPLLKPDLVLVEFSEIDRREFIAANGEVLHFLPSDSSDSSLVLQDAWAHLKRLGNGEDDRVNFYKSYSSIASLLKNTPFYCAFDHEKTMTEVESLFDENLNVGALLCDENLPLPAAHMRLAEKTLRKIDSTDWIKKFSL